MSRLPGRPRVSLDIEDVELLRQLRFTWTRISEILGVSHSTLYRRLEEEGISQETFFTEISDNELDRMMLEIKVNHPNDGKVIMMGHLTSHGIYVPQAWLRASIHRVDHDNTAARSLTVHRRV